mmetsp:Transcript_3457/g.9023  ORF Transcript_3457/g.9023 Transcript_3457/m.9023 type:complete len:445 (-) Transcript_3457:898-2232(-)
MGAPTRCNRRYSIPAVLLAVILLSCHRSLGAFGLEGAAGNGGEKHFIHISGDGKSFALDGKDFFVHGFNQPQMMTHAVENKKHILEVLGDAELHGFNLMRTWAFNDGFDQWQALQPLPGIFDEQVFRALDYVLMQSRKHKIRVLLSITNQWDDYGGANQYVKWANLSAEEAHGGQPFYSNLKCREMYKDFARALVNRRNIYTGIRYRDDEYIFGWDLINEPRVESGAGASQLQFWTWEMAAYLKRLDPNHLVTVGSEGFFAREDYPGAREEDKVSDLFAVDEVNPASWAAQTGQDFVANHRLEGIDFATVHLWPDTWNQSSEAFQERWINAHVEVAGSKLAKPLIVQEFGKKEAPDAQNSTERDRVYQMVNGLVEESVAGRGDLKGSLFWNWEMDLLVGAKEDPYTLRDTDDTWDLIQSHALKMHNLSKSQVYSCDDFELHPLY